VRRLQPRVVVVDSGRPPKAHTAIKREGIIVGHVDMELDPFDASQPAMGPARGGLQGPQQAPHQSPTHAHSPVRRHDRQAGHVHAAGPLQRSATTARPSLIRSPAPPSAPVLAAPSHAPWNRGEARTARTSFVLRSVSMRAAMAPMATPPLLASQQSRGSCLNARYSDFGKRIVGSSPSFSVRSSSKHAAVPHGQNSTPVGAAAGRGAAATAAGSPSVTSPMRPGPSSLVELMLRPSPSAAAAAAGVWLCESCAAAVVGGHMCACVGVTLSSAATLRRFEAVVDPPSSCVSPHNHQLALGALRLGAPQWQQQRRGSMYLPGSHSRVYGAEVRRERPLRRGERHGRHYGCNKRRVCARATLPHKDRWVRNGLDTA
jgi:hypothetical protein